MTKEAQGLPQDTLVGEIEAGLEGLPASAWRTETAWPADYAGYVVCGFFGETPHMPRLPQAQAFVVTDDDFDDDLNAAMARHVARCSPDNIRKLIAGYRSLSEANAALEVELAEVKALDEDGSIESLLFWKHQKEAAEAALSAATAEVERLKGALEAIVAENENGSPHDMASNAELFMVDIARTAIAASKAEAAEGGNDLEGGK